MGHTSQHDGKQLSPDPLTTSSLLQEQSLSRDTGAFPQSTLVFSEVVAAYLPAGLFVFGVVFSVHEP